MQDNITVDIHGNTETLKTFLEPEQCAVYQAVLVYNSHIFTDDNLFSSFENAFLGAFVGKPATRETIFSDKTADFRIYKRYLDSTNYIPQEFCHPAR